MCVIGGCGLRVWGLGFRIEQLGFGEGGREGGREREEERREGARRRRGRERGKGHMIARI